MSRLERLFGCGAAEPTAAAPTPVAIESFTFSCSACGRTHATLKPGPDNGYLLRFNPDGIGIRHVRETVYDLYCPACGSNEEQDIPLPFDEFRRVMAESGAPLDRDAAGDV